MSKYLNICKYYLIKNICNSVNSAKLFIKKLNNELHNKNIFYQIDLFILIKIKPKIKKLNGENFF